MYTGRNDPFPCGSGKKYKKCCLSKAYQELCRVDSLRSKLVQDLLRFFNSKYGHMIDDAGLLFWGDFNQADHLDDATLDIASQNFWEWIILIVDTENDKTLIDLYMEKTRVISADEHKVLNMMRNSVISLYEVQEVFPHTILRIGRSKLHRSQ